MKPPSRAPILIMAGGTGGHVFPALALARLLRAASHEVVWLGTKAGLEARVIPPENIEIEWLAMSGLRGKGAATLLVAPFKLVHSIWQALGVMRRRRPGLVVGFGGFVTGPGGVAAWLTGRPLDMIAVIGIILLIVTALLAALAVSLMRRARRIISTGAQVPGVVVDLHKYPSRRTPVTASIVEYTASDGTNRRFESSVRSYPPRHSRGQAVKVAIAPDGEATILEFQELWLGPILIGILAFGALIFAAVCLGALVFGGRT